jgi:hypothetical protein
MDGSLSRFFRKHEVRKLKDFFVHEQVMGLRRRISDLRESIAKGTGDEDIEKTEQLIVHLEDKIEKLKKDSKKSKKRKRYY